MRDKLLHNSFFRFLLVGVGNTLVSMAIELSLYNLVLYDMGRTGPVLSSAAGFLVGAVMSFFLNRHFTFHSEEELGRSAVTHPLLQPWLAERLQAVFVEKWANSVSLVVCMGLYTVLNYFGQRFFAFRRDGKQAGKEDKTDHAE